MKEMKCCEYCTRVLFYGKSYTGDRRMPILSMKQGKHSHWSQNFGIFRANFVDVQESLCRIFKEYYKRLNQMERLTTKFVER